MSTPEHRTPEDFYGRRISRMADVIAEGQQQDRRLSFGRLAAFLVFAAIMIAAISSFGSWLFVLALLAFFGFVAVVGYHERVKETLNRNNQDSRLAQNQLSRMKRDWSALPDKTANITSTLEKSTTVLDDFVVADLDMFGAGSLWQLVSRASTPLGVSTLYDWLRNPADPNEVGARQAAVRALVGQPDLCHEFTLNSFLLADARGDSSTSFLHWADGDGWLRRLPGLVWGTRILGVVTMVVLAGVLFRLLPLSWIFVTLALIAANVVVNMLWIGKVHDIFNHISAGKFDLQYYIALFQTVAELPEQPERLGELKSKMRVGDVSFETALGKLSRILAFANGRKSGLLAIPWLFAQILFFWDFHVLLRLEAWQRTYGSQVRVWFQAVGELEALVSLATLAHDNPEWCFPAVDESNAKFVADGLGHPLLSPDECVRNEIEFGPEQSFLLVTGSNMSGKSTLLRSIGLATVLGLAGGPVCAKSVKLPRVVIATSMRITDSLNSGVSYFMAELKRVKEIVDRARELDASGEPRMLYLLDEILQGTNSAERHVAVARILQHLLRTKAIGAISTHDLELANSEELKSRCQTVHLRERIEQTANGDKMQFDYIVRPGVTPTTNALRLLEMVGLTEAE